MTKPEFYLVDSFALIRPEYCETLEEAAEKALQIAEDYEEDAEIIGCYSYFWLDPRPQPEG